jgi:hypothetical protein
LTGASMGGDTPAAAAASSPILILCHTCLQLQLCGSTGRRTLFIKFSASSM